MVLELIMGLTSEKFKYLWVAKNLLPFESVPEFEVLKTLSARKVHERLILRSSLKQEASKGQLLSGKSLSISGIDSWHKLQQAWNDIQKQTDLDEIILQREIQYVSHVTLFWEKDFFFAELKSMGQKHFLYWTPLVQSLCEETKILRQLVLPLQLLLEKEDSWLMEIGIKDKKAYLFQLHPIELELVTQIFSSEMISKIVSSRMRFSKSQGLWSLLKTEWKARKFRNKNHQEIKPSSIFMNWEYLFHYFRFFCMIKRSQPSQQMFADFLAFSFQNRWLSRLIKKHLDVAQFFLKDKMINLTKTGFDTHGPIFIGKGIIQGIAGKDIIVCEEISLSIIYQKDKPLAIISKEIGLLSHPVLASVENGISIILGIENLPSEGESIFLDFDQRVFRTGSVSSFF